MMRKSFLVVTFIVVLVLLATYLVTNQVGRMQRNTAEQARIRREIDSVMEKINKCDSLEVGYAYQPCSPEEVQDIHTQLEDLKSKQQNLD